MKSSKDSRFSKTVASLAALLVAFGASIFVGATLSSANGTENEKKVVVCKWVTTPDGELDHIIISSVSTLPDEFDGTFPFDFEDAQASTAVRYAMEGEQAKDVPVSDCAPKAPLVQPDPQVTVATETQSSCDGVQSRTKTVTTEYVLNADETAYVLGTPGAPVYSAWTMDRELTAAESTALGCDEVAVAEQPTKKTTTTTTTVAPAAAVPTAVSAGLDDTSASSGSLVGQGLMAGGLLLLLLAGVSRLGRREGGAHEA